MVISTCPYSLQGQKLRDFDGVLGKINVIAVHQAKSDFVPAHTGPLSIKYVLHGSETYELNSKRLTVTPINYLIMNREQSYESLIHAADITTSFCVFFAHDFVRDACQYLRYSGAHLLDNGLDSADSDINFYQQLYWRDEEVQRHLKKAPGVTHQAPSEALAVDEWCADALQSLLCVHYLERSRWKSLSAARESTKKEVYRRLAIAVDYMHEYYNTDVGLSHLARIAGLSSFHFLRSFKQGFHISPHQYLTTLRIQHARMLLRRTALEINTVCEACGFRDESSFIRLFKKVNGVTPMQFRNSG